MNQESRVFEPDAGGMPVLSRLTSKASEKKVQTVQRRRGFYATRGKRMFDLAVTLACLPMILPVLGILWLLVRRDGGPFLFAHPRVGQSGETFPCLKIRTMVVDAETVLKNLLESDAERAKEWNTHFKLRDDPRVTRLGRVLRATSLDELPQIFNVLKGEMSIVGPRPITAVELDLYGDMASDYRAARPGLTGPWQVTGRRNNEFTSRARLDAEYVASMSFLGDVSILLRTVPEVLFARGR